MIRVIRVIRGDKGDKGDKEKSVYSFHGKSTPDPSHIHGNPLVATSGKVSLLIDVDTMDTTRPLEVHEIHKEKKAQDLTRQPAERSADLLI